MPRSSLTYALLLGIAVLALTGCSISQAMRVKDRQRIDVKTMIGELRGTQVIFVGERHDSPLHHQLQLEVLQRMQEGGRPVALGMEMFEDRSQGSLDAWSEGKLSEADFKLIFERNWRNIPWALYRDILLFARDHRIPVLGLNPPRVLVSKVSREGFGSLTSDELRLLPAGMTVETSDSYLQFMKSAYAVHGGRGESFRHVCEAQMLRNRVMAQHISNYIHRHPGAMMVVLTGGIHAREKGGIPTELADIPFKVVLPPIPSLSADTVTGEDADYLLEEPFFGIPEML